MDGALAKTVESSIFYRSFPVVKNDVDDYLACVEIDRGEAGFVRLTGNLFPSNEQAMQCARKACEAMGAGKWREDGWYYETGHA